MTQLRCDECGTELSGSFAPNEFTRLSGDKLEFLRIFLVARGNLKQVEEQLQISYPTVRARLDSLLEHLGLAGGNFDAVDKSAVLEALERGELSLEEAESRLRGEE